MDLTLNLVPCDDGRFLSWTGTVVIDGVTYGWSDEPLFVPDPPQQPNDKFVYGEENWTIFTLEPGEDPNESPQPACDAFDAYRVLLAGFNTAWGGRQSGGRGQLCRSRRRQSVCQRGTRKQDVLEREALGLPT
jgi:hypothetical protein